MKPNKKLLNIAFFFWQITWGCFQTALGFLIFLFNINKKHSFYKGCLVTQWNYPASVSLGFFVFATNKNRIGLLQFSQTIAHEYGHCLQSLILGPFYLIIIGLPSVLWLTIFKNYRLKKKISYYWFYPEKWANKLGGVDNF